MTRKPPKSGMKRVDLVGLAFPPGRDLRVEGVGRLQPPDLDRRAEPCGEIDPDAVGPECPRQGRRLPEVLGQEARGVRVDVGQDRAVDPDRGVRARVVGDARVDVVGQLVPVPQREAGVAALDRPVQVVPVVEHPVADSRGLDDGRGVHRVPGLQPLQEAEDAVQDPDVGVRRDHRRALPGDRRGADEEALVADLPEVRAEVEGRDRRRPRRRPGHERAVPAHRVDEGHVRAEHPAQAAGHLVAGRPQRGRSRAHHHLADRGRAGQRPVPQPELVAVLGPRGGSREQGGEGQTDEPGAQEGTSGTRASWGSAQRSFGTSGVQPGRSGSWS